MALESYFCNLFLNSIVLTDTDIGVSLADLTLISGTTPLAPDASLFYFVTDTLTVDLLNTASVEANPTDGGGTDLPGLPNVTASDTAQVRIVTPAAVGDYVWLDDDINGFQGAAERGVNGITVRLLDGAGNATGRTTTTANHPTSGEAGWYEFTNLLPGAYQVEFVNPNLFVYAFTSRNRTDTNPDPDARDSDADVLTGRSEPFTLAAGETNRTVDAGLIAPTALKPGQEPTVGVDAQPLFLPLVGGR
jgi:hypothetical protein